MPNSTSLALTAAHQGSSATIVGRGGARWSFRRAAAMFQRRVAAPVPSPQKHSRIRLAYFIRHARPVRDAPRWSATAIARNDIHASLCRGSLLPEPFVGLLPDARGVDADVAQHVLVERGEQAAAAAARLPLRERAGEAWIEAVPTSRHWQGGDR